MIFDTLPIPFMRRSIENPAVPLGSLHDDWGLASNSASGIAVTKDKALMYPAFWRGVNLISRDIAKLPLFIYRRKGEGKERAPEHPAYRLLRYKPNDDMTAFVFRQTIQAHALCQGNGYAYIVRAGDASPRELLPLMPDKTWPVRANGQLLYVTEVDGVQRKLLPENVLHIKGLGYDGLVGYNVITYAADALGLGLAAQQYGSRYFRNNARPSVVIEVPNAMNPEAAKNMLANWNNLHSGLDNSHRAALMTNGAKVNPITINARDSQLMELREFQLRDISNVLGIPPHRLGDTTRTSHSSLEQENQSYLDDALDGWLCNWEAETSDKLLTEAEKDADSHVIEFMRQALVRADLTARAEYYAKSLAGNPWMTQDQVRSLENMDPMGGSASELLPPPNATKGQEQPATSNTPEDVPADDTPPPAQRTITPELTESLRGLLRHAAGRMANRMGDDARRVAKRPSEFTDWLDKIGERHRSVVIEELTAVIAPAMIVAGTSCDAAQLADVMIGDMRTSLNTVSDKCTYDTLVDGVDAAVSMYVSSMPAKIADSVLCVSQT